MSYPFIDWELVESKNFGIYRYDILKVEDSNHTRFYRGFVIFKGGDFWIEHKTIDGVRSGLMLLGQQNS